MTREEFIRAAWEASGEVVLTDYVHPDAHHFGPWNDDGEEVRFKAALAVLRGEGVLFGAQLACFDGEVSVRARDPRHLNVASCDFMAGELVAEEPAIILGDTLTGAELVLRPNNSTQRSE